MKEKQGYQIFNLLTCYEVEMYTGNTPWQMKLIVDVIDLMSWLCLKHVSGFKLHMSHLMKLMRSSIVFYEIINVNYFCEVRHKNRRKHNQYFKLLFFQVYLHFDTSNWQYTNRKTNLFTLWHIKLTIYK